MIRRRMAVLLVAVAGVIGLLLAQTPSDAGGRPDSKGNVHMTSEKGHE